MCMMRILFKPSAVIAVAIVALMTVVSCETPDAPTKQVDPEPLNTIIPLGVGDSEIRFDVTARNEDDEYVVACVEQELLVEAGIFTSEMLVAYHNDLYTERAVAEGVALREYLTAEGMLLKGNKQALRFDGLRPATVYVVCCYGVEFTKEGSLSMTTAIAYEEFTTTAPELADVKFKLTTRVDGNNAVVNITPSEYDGMYYCCFVAEGDPLYLPEEQSMDSSYCHELRSAMYDRFSGYAADGLLSGNYTYNGVVTLREELEPETRYMVVCFAVNNAKVPVMSSKPAISRFRTLDAEQRMVVDIAVTDITPYNARLTLTPSKDVPYTSVFLSWEQYSFAEEYSDMMVMETILSNFMPAVFRDEHSEMLTPLMPDTEYVVVAFGVDGQIPVSELFIYRFTTPVAISGTNSITGYTVHKIFDTEAIVALDSSLDYLVEECECVVIAEVHTEKPVDDVYWWWYYADQREIYTDEAFLEDLLLWGYTPTLTAYGLWYDEEYIFAGVVEDENGNLSEINYGDVFVPTREDCSPAEEFFDYVNTEVMSQSCVITR